MLPTEEHSRTPVKTLSVFWFFLIGIYRLLLSCDECHFDFFVETSCLVESFLCVPTEIIFVFRLLCCESLVLICV